MPTGFKNGTDGGIDIAVQACRAAQSGHCFLSVGKEGLCGIVETEVWNFPIVFHCFIIVIYPLPQTLVIQGNPDVHIILRGGSSGPNYSAPFVQACGEKLAKAGQLQKIMVFSFLTSSLGW